MAYRPNPELRWLRIQNPGPQVTRITAEFTGANDTVFTAEIMAHGDPHPSLQGADVRFEGPGRTLEMPAGFIEVHSPDYLDGFKGYTRDHNPNTVMQVAVLGDCMLGGPGQPYAYTYVEWYVLDPDLQLVQRVVLELPDAAPQFAIEPHVEWDNQAIDPADLLETHNRWLSESMGVQVVSMNPNEIPLNNMSSSGHGVMPHTPED